MKLIRKIGLIGVIVGISLTVFSVLVLLDGENYGQNVTKLVSVLAIPAILALIIGSFSTLLSFRNSFR